MNRPPISKVYNIDCIKFMKKYKDKYFDLAIVDPPYGIKADSMQGGKGKNKKWVINKISKWDNNIPSKEYFIELFRVSKNQIIWGGNYFITYLYNTKCFLIWDKNNYDRSFSDCEFAWTSFNKVSRIFKMRPMNMDDNGKIHPTQKPIKLYKWILNKYGNIGDKILDTHLGSGSSRIASYEMGFDFYGTEIDIDYFIIEEQRFYTKCLKKPYEKNYNTKVYNTLFEG